MRRAMVIGSGGREHAIAWRLVKSPVLEKVYCFSGNPGTATEPKIENVSPQSSKELIEFIKANNVSLVFIGPEKPLAEGMADLLRKNGIAVFGFGKEQAKLESSKIFSKQFCEKHKISQPLFREFTDSSLAIAFLEENSDKKFFVKADELCGGKGAIPAPTLEDGIKAVSDLLIKKKCGVGEKIVIEGWIEGFEITIMAFTDGKTISIMPASQDHKRLLDNDAGPNTGGMGAYAPAPAFDSEVEENFRKDILSPTLDGLKEEGFNDAGIIYFGLIVNENKQPFLLEYNARMGDPETQPLMLLLESDLFELVDACVEGKLAEYEGKIRWGKESAVCVTLSVKGYPENYGSEKETITGINEAERIQGVKVFHAGTAILGGELVTNGGRILSVAAKGIDFGEARKKAYEAIEKIKFEGMHFRSDIGAKR